jgi:isopenicillin-N N-acyltransferase-like protein
MHTFPIIEVHGDALQRGRQHGQAARARIAHSIATYARLFAFCGIDWATAQTLAIGYRDVISAFDPALMTEIEGIAEGAGRHVNEILALNARTEILPPSYPGSPSPDWSRVTEVNAKAGVPQWAQVAGVKPGTSLAGDTGECTSIAVSPAQSTTGHTLLAQNWDWLGAQRTALILLRVASPDGHRCLTLTEAGMLAKIGFNDRGFGVCLNILRSADDGTQSGVPVHVLLRGLLNCGSVAEAKSRTQALRFGGSSNILCADLSGARAALEISPRGLYTVDGAASALCHTNHFIEPAAAAHQAALAPSLSTYPRLERVEALVQEHASKKYSPQDLQTFLRDESAGHLSICRRPDPALAPEACIETVASVVMDLGARAMYLAPEVPSTVDYTLVSLS